MTTYYMSLYEGNKIKVWLDNRARDEAGLTVIRVGNIYETKNYYFLLSKDLIQSQNGVLEVQKLSQNYDPDDNEYPTVKKIKILRIV